MKILFSFFLLFFIISISQAEEVLQQEIVQHTKKGVVNIANNVKMSAYSHNGLRRASGFIINKEKGIILTNAHVAKQSMINDLRITFYNGREITATLIYSDPLIDFAFLRIDPKELSTDITELKFSKTPATLDQNIFIIGNNEGKAFSLQTGIISSTYDNTGLFSNQTLRISLNTKGGSSGSPVLNYKGEVVGLNFAGSNTSSSSVKISYVIDALHYIEKDKIPPRKASGLGVSYYSLDHAIKFARLNKGHVTKHIKKYPGSFNQILIVSRIPSTCSANKVLQPGDIIWKVNNVEIGPELYQMQKMINNAGDSISMTIYRNGKLKNVEVDLYDVHKHSIMKMVKFAGAVFYEVNYEMSRITGAPVGSVMITNISETSIFDKLPVAGLRDFVGYLRLIKVYKMGEQEINTIDDVIRSIPSLIQKKNFTIDVKNYLFHLGYNGHPMMGRNMTQYDIEYYDNGNNPLIFIHEKSDWKIEKIPVK